MENLKVGQEIWIEKTRIPGNPACIYSRKIEKIGKKYLYADNMKFDLKTLREVSDYSSEYCIYFSEKECRDKVEREDTLFFLGKYFSFMNPLRQNISLEKLRKIRGMVENELNMDEKEKFMRI